MVSVKSIESLENLDSSVNGILGATNDATSKSLEEVAHKLIEIEEELLISQNMLEISIDKESYSEGELNIKISEHLQAESELSEAIASEDLIAIALASEDVEQTANAVRLAEQEYEEAKQSRMRMEQRVALVHRSFQIIEELFEYMQTLFGNNIEKISSLYYTLNIRLNNAKSSLENYISANYNSSDIQIQRGIRSEKYEYLLLKNKKNLVTKEELNDAYIKKLKSLNGAFRSSQYAYEEGVKISQYGLPEFESEVNFFIRSKDFSKNRENHFRTCNSYLKKKTAEDEDLKENFSKRQLNQIQIGKTPEGYTWHHDGNPPPGRMQLVKSEKHDKVRHDGGYSLWKRRN